MTKMVLVASPANDKTQLWKLQLWKVDSRGVVEGKLCQSYSIDTSDTIVEVTAVKVDWGGVVAGELCLSYPEDGVVSPLYQTPLWKLLCES